MVAVGVVVSKQEVEVNQAPKTALNMSWAKGMIGVMPVFDSLEAAVKYYGEGFKMFSFDVEVAE